MGREATRLRCAWGSGGIIDAQPWNCWAAVSGKEALDNRASLRLRPESFGAAAGEPLLRADGWLSPQEEAGGVGAKTVAHLVTTHAVALDVSFGPYPPTHPPPSAASWRAAHDRVLPPHLGFTASPGSWREILGGENIPFQLR